MLDKSSLPRPSTIFISPILFRLRLLTLVRFADDGRRLAKLGSVCSSGLTDSSLIVESLCVSSQLLLLPVLVVVVVLPGLQTVFCCFLNRGNERKWKNKTKSLLILQASPTEPTKTKNKKKRGTNTYHPYATY